MLLPFAVLLYAVSGSVIDTAQIAVNAAKLRISRYLQVAMLLKNLVSVAQAQHHLRWKTAMLKKSIIKKDRKKYAEQFIWCFIWCTHAQSSTLLFDGKKEEHIWGSVFRFFFFLHILLTAFMLKVWDKSILWNNDGNCLYATLILNEKWRVLRNNVLKEIWCNYWNFKRHKDVLWCSGQNIAIC